MEKLGPLQPYDDFMMDLGLKEVLTTVAARCAYVKGLQSAMQSEIRKLRLKVCPVGGVKRQVEEALMGEYHTDYVTEGVEDLFSFTMANADAIKKAANSRQVEEKKE